MSNPNNLKYTKSHEWVTEPNNNRVKIGITDYAQKELGDVVFISLPKIGETFNQGDSFSQVESVKAVSDIYAPISGKVTAINELLNTSPETINLDPYNGAWIIELEVTKPSETSSLLATKDYDAMLAEISK